MEQALTIAGSDSGGGAGIQADIKAIEAQGVFATSVITAVTAQNTVEVREALTLPASLVRSQLEAVLDDFDIAAVKTGMLSTAKIIEVVARVIEQQHLENLVVDPVMISKSGFKLLDDDAISALRDRLIPLALVVTPNIPEAALLARMTIESRRDMREAGRRIQHLGARAVVVKGGHAAFDRGTDVLLDSEACTELVPQQVFDKTVHGTGCTFSAAITARLALGESLVEAVHKAKAYVTSAIEHAPKIGSGHPPGRHFFDKTRD